MGVLEERAQRKNRLRNSLQKAFSLKGDTAEYHVIEERILSSGEVKGSNLCILVLAALIASIGLNMNSTAVIIGAMLISPLMGGIMAIAYGIATSDLHQARNSVWGLVIQVASCLAIAVLYFLISPVKTPTDELMARTTPNIWDVLIACFGGFAGMIGVTRKEKSNVIPGVAIATALMPPLCTAGYGIATWNLSCFLGAAYLFLINSYFICLSSVIILLFIDVPKRSNAFEQINLKKLKRRIVRNTIILIIPSLFFGAQLIRQEMNPQSATMVVDGKQVINLERLTKEIQLIEPSVQKVEIQEIFELDKENVQINTNKVVITSSKKISHEQKVLIRDFMKLEIQDCVVEWHVEEVDTK